MTETQPDQRSEQRADELLPEERAAGSDDPSAQAAAVLADSDEREAVRGREELDEAAGGTDEHRRSEETVDP